jgi:DNA repair exonuclease SbcCD ATPase subunit
MARAPPPLPDPAVSQEVLREEVRHCDPVSLIVYEDPVFKGVTRELKEELEIFISKQEKGFKESSEQESTFRKMEQTVKKNKETLREIEKERNDKCEPKRDEIELELRDRDGSALFRDLEHYEAQSIDLSAKLNEKIVDYEETKFENAQVKAVLDARGNFVSDTDRIRKQYGQIITDNLTDQRDKYKEILEGIAEHSRDLAKAKQIELQLIELLESIKQSAEDQIHEKLSAQAELERELDEIQAKIKTQEQLLNSLTDKACSL